MTSILHLQHPEFFENVPTPERLKSDSGAYTQLINAVIQHAVNLAKGHFPIPEIFDPVKVNLIEPDIIRFKRKESTPDLSFFQGSWQNSNSHGKLSSVVIVITDAKHANIKARYMDFPGEFSSTAEFNAETKALEGSVTLVPGKQISNTKFLLPIVSLYSVSNPTAGPILVVKNSQGSPANTTDFVDTFSSSSI